MKTYPEYKDSNLPWLGKIPVHWDILRVKHLFKLVKAPNRDVNPTVLSLTQQGIKIRDVSTNEGQLPESYEGYNTVKPGDICLNPMDLESGAAAASKYYGVISNAYFTLRPLNRQYVNTKFYSEYFKLHYYLKIFFPYGKGVGRPRGSGGRWTLNKDIFMRFSLVYPPKEEQDKVVAFLIYKANQIAKFIRNKRRLIELLQEQKQAIINQAVTRGINPNVRLKPSGVDYLGDIPEHWELIPLRWYIAVSSGEFLSGDKISAVSSDTFPNPVIGGNGVMGYTNILNSDSKALVIGRVGALCGNIHLVNGPCWITDNALKITHIKKLDHEYLALQLESMNLNRLAKANAQPLITGGIIKSQKVALPPIQEQKDILEYLKSKLEEIEKIIGRTRREIDLIREYRTRLIFDAVTGKIDVRDITVESIEKLQDYEELNMVEEEQMQEELRNFEEKTYENF